MPFGGLRSLLRAVVAFAIALGIFGLGGRGLALVEPPELARRVTDGAGMLSPSFAAELERFLEAYERETGHQFAFVSVPSLAGGTIEDFCLRTAERWKLGDAKRDDGLLLCVAKTERKMRIEVGYGLEGAVTDVLAARVVRYEMRPRFQSGDFDGGVRAAFAVLRKAAEGEAVRVGPPERNEPSEGSRFLHFLPLLLLVLLVASGRGGALPWLLLSSATGGRSRGGSGFGGFSGGGGGFGGGGASGDW